MTAREYFEKIVPELLTTKKEILTRIAASYEFQITGDHGGTWTLDLKQDPPALTEEGSGTADCTVIMEDEHFANMVTGTLKPQMAFLTGKLKVTGNMALALKLTALFG